MYLDRSQKIILFIFSIIISFFGGAIVESFFEKPIPIVFQVESNAPVFRSPLYNLNTITQEELCDLPGIGVATAKKILTYRKNNILFRTLDELKKVPTIGTKKFNKLKAFFYL